MIDGQKNKYYWDDIETIAKDGLKRLLAERKRSADSGTVHSSVRDEILKIFKVLIDKTFSFLKFYIFTGKDLR